MCSFWVRSRYFGYVWSETNNNLEHAWYLYTEGELRNHWHAVPQKRWNRHGIQKRKLEALGQLNLRYRILKDWKLPSNSPLFSTYRRLKKIKNLFLDCTDYSSIIIVQTLHWNKNKGISPEKTYHHPWLEQRTTCSLGHTAQLFTYCAHVPT